jgi:hypothetical protein
LVTLWPDGSCEWQSLTSARVPLWLECWDLAKFLSRVEGLMPADWQPKPAPAAVIEDLIRTLAPHMLRKPK